MMVVVQADRHPGAPGGGAAGLLRPAREGVPAGDALDGARPGSSGWLLAFTSLDDVVVASFTSGPGASTLPMVVFSPRSG